MTPDIYQPTPSLLIKDLSTGYSSRRGKRTVAHGLNGSLMPGTFTCLLGVNGAGKSTLLRTLSGFLKPLAGEIIISGMPLASFRASELPRQLGVVLTERISATNMTVADLVGLGRAPYTGFWGRLGDCDRRTVARAISLVGIDNLAQRNIATLSDGERQKAMIAKALAQDTPIIFLDEPTAFLDYPGKIEIMRLLRRLAHDEGKTIFLSTHDLPLAIQTADSLWLLDQRLGLSVGSPQFLIDDGSFARYFDRGDVVFNSSTASFTIPL